MLGKCQDIVHIDTVEQLANLLKELKKQGFSELYARQPSTSRTIRVKVAFEDLFTCDSINNRNGAIKVH